MRGVTLHTTPRHAYSTVTFQNTPEHGAIRSEEPHEWQRGYAGMRGRDAQGVWTDAAAHRW